MDSTSAGTPSAGDSRPDEAMDAKKARRRFTNRESARRVRARRSAEWHALQQQLGNLTRQNQELSTRVSQLQGQKQNLLTHLIEVIARHRALSLENAALQQELVEYQGVDPYACLAPSSSAHPASARPPALSADLAPKLPSPSDIPQFDDMTWVDVMSAAESCRQGLPTAFSSLMDAPKQAAMQPYSSFPSSSGFDGAGITDLLGTKFDSSRLYSLHHQAQHDASRF